jgi:apolipoprotein D and lipocalin family protein
MNYSKAQSARQAITGSAFRWSVGVAGLFLSACSSVEPLATVDHVDLDRFMGDWYVIANIPTSIETEAFNAIESYRLDEDGSIATTFTFNKGSFTGEKKRYEPRGFVRNTQSNAEWGMQFIWPIKADYRIIYLDDDYQLTVIGRNKRDYVWVMARNSSISDEQYSAMVKLVADAGYDTTKIRKVPQQW